MGWVYGDAVVKDWLFYLITVLVGFICCYYFVLYLWYLLLDWC